MTDNFIPTYLHHRQRQEELRRTEERRNFNLQNVPNNSTQVASQSVTFQKKHLQSMSDALKDVRKSKQTIPDGLFLRPENN
ncbi:hypothetical protein OAR00_00315 [Alphaproteobacteria bacterium]|nr:hypothetical protein [Alphaproteobacteria bacterium]